MRVISCPTCHQYAMAPNGNPLVIANYTAGQHPMVIKCARCGASFKLRQIEFNRLPQVVGQVDTIQ